MYILCKSRKLVAEKVHGHQTGEKKSTLWPSKLRARNAVEKKKKRKKEEIVAGLSGTSGTSSSAAQTVAAQ